MSNNWKYHIADIRFQGEHAYLLVNPTLTSKTIEAQLATMPIYRMDRKPYTDARYLPPITLPFFLFTLLKNRIPNEPELVTFYTKSINGSIQLFKEGLDAGDFSPEVIQQRIYRAYPSIVREYHFFHLLQESGKFDRVTYSLRKDVADGIDVLLELNGFKFALALYADTPRANAARDHKTTPDYLFHTELCLRLDDTSRQVGKFYLYDNSHVEFVFTALEKFAFLEKGL